MRGGSWRSWAPRLLPAIAGLVCAAVLVAVVGLTNFGGSGSAALVTPSPAPRAQDSSVPEPADAKLPPASTSVSPAVEKALLERGIRVVSEGAFVDAATGPNVVMRDATAIPVSLSLVRITDLRYGQLVDESGRPLTEAGPRSGGEVARFIEDRLVWLAIYSDAEIGFGGSFIRSLDKNGQPAEPAASAGSEPFVTDLFVIRDATTGAVLKGGSISY